jgi:hypothetical protein
VVEEADGDLMGDGVNIAARLEGVGKPGAICLSEQAYWQVKGRLDLKVTDLGATQLKNIAEPIHIYSLEVGHPVQAKLAPLATIADRAKQLVSKPLSLSVPLGWYLLNGGALKPAEARHLSIVVLPFANLSGDPSQEYFADGITENLTSDLSRIKGAFVIARNTAFTYKGKNVDAKEVGKELGVRYLLEGSVHLRRPKGEGRQPQRCSLKRSATPSSNRSVHRCAPVSVSISCGSRPNLLISASRRPPM